MCIYVPSDSTRMLRYPSPKHSLTHIWTFFMSDVNLQAAGLVLESSVRKLFLQSTLQTVRNTSSPNPLQKSPDWFCRTGSNASVEVRPDMLSKLSCADISLWQSVCADCAGMRSVTQTSGDAHRWLQKHSCLSLSLCLTYTLFQTKNITFIILCPQSVIEFLSYNQLGFSLWKKIKWQVNHFLAKIDSMKSCVCTACTRDDVCLTAPSSGHLNTTQICRVSHFQDPANKIPSKDGLLTLPLCYKNVISVFVVDMWTLK